jgi:hypothetical protein
VRWAVPNDLARYRLVWFYSTVRQQTMRLVADRGSRREFIDLVVNSQGTLVQHDRWYRAAGAQQVNGRPTFWLKRIDDRFLRYPYVQMDWEYTDGAWASLMLTREEGTYPPVADVVSAAAKVRFGVAERLKLPLWFTEPPAGMRVAFLRLAPPTPSKPTLEASMDLAGVEHDGRLRVAVSTPDPRADSPSQREGYTTVDGHPRCGPSRARTGSWSGCRSGASTGWWSASRCPRPGGHGRGSPPTAR